MASNSAGLLDEIIKSSKPPQRNKVQNKKTKTNRPTKTKKEITRTEEEGKKNQD